MPKLKPIAALETALRQKAMSFPEAKEDMPWGHSAFKVKGKTFCFMSNEDVSFGASFKLPETGGKALLLPFATPTGYGLGKAGRVSVQFGPKETVPVDLLFAWMTESFRAIAPKKVVAALDAANEQGKAKKEVATKPMAAAKKRSVAIKPATPKPVRRRVKAD